MAVSNLPFLFLQPQVSSSVRLAGQPLATEASCVSVYLLLAYVGPQRGLPGADLSPS